MIERMLFKGGSLETMKRALDVYANRGRVLARNVANVDTPGYRAQVVTFEDDLKLALRTRAGEGVDRSHDDHLSPAKDLPMGDVEYRNPEGTILGNGINDVEIDQEMSEIAANTIRYTVAAQMVSQAYDGLRKAIRGRMA